MGNMELVDVMTETPGHCFNCGGTPSELDESGTMVNLPAVKFSMVDFNYGDTPYLCSECASLTADLLGRVSLEEHDQLRAKHEELQEDYKKVKGQAVALKKRLEKIVDGAKAKKEVKEALSR